MNDVLFNVWGSDETVIGIASNRFGSGHFILSAYHNEAAHTLGMVLDATDEKAELFQNGNMVGFVDMDGLYQLFTITESEITAADASTRSIYAEHVLYELAQEPILSFNGSASISYALTLALMNTRWELSYSVEAGSQTVTRTNTDVLTCLKATASAYGVELDFYVTVANNTIVSRNVRAVTRLGTDRGRRFEYTKDTSTIKGKLSIANVKTALIGLGKGSQDDGSGRLTFADVEWSVAGGDPADKSSGAVFVEDAAAKAQYGLAGGTRNRVGFVTFDNIEDPEELLQATWEELQEQKEPTASYTLTVMDLEESEGTHEAVRVGDDVYVIHRKISPPIALSVRVTDVKRDLLSPANTKIQLGDATSMISTTIKETAALAAKAKSINENGTIPTDYLQGAIDALTNQLIGSGAYATASVIEGKGILMENTNPASPDFGALYLGPGILSIANTKTAGAWNWRTFGTGAGFTADEVTTGILNAAIIKILGTDQFYWDAGNIIVTDPEDSSRQLRLGKYDGTHYGFAITTDGGTTWSQAITFDGVVATNLNAATGTFVGQLIAATGTFSGALEAASGTFTGDLQAAGGTFSGTLQAAGGTFANLMQANPTNAWQRLYFGQHIVSEDDQSGMFWGENKLNRIVLDSTGVLHFFGDAGFQFDAPSGYPFVLNATAGFTVNGVNIEDAIQGIADDLVEHEGDTNNPHSVSYDQVGADASGAAAAVQDNLESHAGNTSNPHGVTPGQIGAVPTSRTVNGKALSSDISLNASDVAAAALAHAHGNLSSDGKIGAQAGMFVITGTGGGITVATPAAARVYLRMFPDDTEPSSPSDGDLWFPAAT